MDSVVNSLMLVCAVIVALGAGVLLGYMACKALFALCSMHARSLGASRSTAKAEAQVANA